MDESEPNYEVLPGWNDSVKNVTRFEDLPANAKKYIDFIESNLDTSISHISVGKNRDQIIKR